MNFSLQSPSAQATSPPPPPAARDLPELQRPAPRQRRGSPGAKILAAGAVALLAVAAVVIGVPGVSKSLGLPAVSALIAGQSVDVITYLVKAANLSVTVKERGNLASS